MEATKKHARPSKRVKTSTDAPRPRPPKVYARTSFFSFHRVLFRYYSQDRNAGVQLRLPVTRRTGPAVDNAATSRVAGVPPLVPPLIPPSSRRRRHPFLPILFYARGSLSSPTFFPLHATATRRVSLTSSTSLSGSWVRLYALRART